MVFRVHQNLQHCQLAKYNVIGRCPSPKLTINVQDSHGKSLPQDRQPRGVAVMFKKAFLVGTAIAVGIPAAGLIAGYFLQDKLLYHPKVPGLNHKTSDNPAGYQSPSDQGKFNASPSVLNSLNVLDIDFEERYISTPDGERLHAWLMRPSAVASSTVPTIVFFHGNAGSKRSFRFMVSNELLMNPIDMGYRLPNMRALIDNVGANILSVDYRG